MDRTTVYALGGRRYLSHSRKVHLWNQPTTSLKITRKVAAPQLLNFFAGRAPPVKGAASVAVAFALPALVELAVLLGLKPPVMMGPKASVLGPMMMSDADGPSEIRVPLMVTAGPPGVRV